MWDIAGVTVVHHWPSETPTYFVAAATAVLYNPLTSINHTEGLVISISVYQDNPFMEKRTRPILHLLAVETM